MIAAVAPARQGLWVLRGYLGRKGGKGQQAPRVPGGYPGRKDGRGKQAPQAHRASLGRKDGREKQALQVPWVFRE